MQRSILTILVVSLFFTTACNNAAKKAKKEKAKALYGQLEKIHTEAMAKYVQVEVYMDSLKKLQTKINKDTLKKMEQKAVSEAYNKAQSAYQGMANWMKKFDSNNEKMQLDKRIDYLDSQLVKVKAVKQKLLESLDLSKKTMTENRDTTKAVSK